MIRSGGVLPEAYAFGLCYALNSVANRPSFLDGVWSPTGAFKKSMILKYERFSDPC